jgi:hypothetical protein
MSESTAYNIATVAERLSADTFLIGHTGAAGSEDDVRVRASDIVTKDVSGQVAIGHNAPEAPLDVQGPSGGQIKVRTSGAEYYQFGRNTADGFLDFYGSQASNVGYRFTSLAFGTLWSIGFTGHFLPGQDNVQDIGSASKRARTLYAGTGAINTSDEREKTDIGEIPDAWLDAWAGVQWSRFKMVDGKRWHVGLVAQQVHAAFAARDLDAFEIGLCCYDAWEEQRASISEEVDGEIIDTGETRVTLKAGDRWGLRYEECQAVEAAWQRRELARLAERLAALEGAPR